MLTREQALEALERMTRDARERNQRKIAAFMYRHARKELATRREASNA